MNFPQKKGPSSQGTYVPNLFTTITISCLFLYSFVTCHWIHFEKKLNFAIEKISIKIHMKKLPTHKVLNTFAP
jgi:hypothetical protein